MNNIITNLERGIGIDLPTLGILALTGFVVGLVARILMPGRDPLGIFGTVFLGISGSYLGSFLGMWLVQRGFSLPLGQYQEYTRYGLAVAGAMLLLVGLKVVRSA